MAKRSAASHSPNSIDRVCDDPCAVRLPPDDGYLCEVLARGLLLDAVRLAPGLAPLIIA